MTSFINLLKALILLALFPILLLATFWLTMMVMGGLAALLALALDTTFNIPVPLYWVDILPQFAWSTFHLTAPTYARPVLILPAPVDVLWSQFVPLANMATHAALPYILGFAVIWLLWGFRYNSRVVAALTDAQPLSYNECPPVYDALEAVCSRAQMPMPKLYLVRTLAPNAFASGLGKRTYSITVTAGLLAILDREEVEAVLAHELSHIKNQDVRLLVIAAVMVGLFSWVASVLWTSVVHTVMGYRSRYAVHVLLLPVVFVAAIPAIIGALLSALVKLLMLREREMGADHGAVALTSADAMASALRVISSDKHSIAMPHALKDMVIYAPAKKRGWLGRSLLGRAWRRLWSTHPSFERRLAALAAQGAKARTRGPALIRISLENPAR